MASNLIAIASNLEAMASNLEAMASNLLSYGVQNQTNPGSTCFTRSTGLLLLIQDSASPLTSPIHLHVRKPPRHPPGKPPSVVHLRPQPFLCTRFWTAPHESFWNVLDGCLLSTPMGPRVVKGPYWPIFRPKLANKQSPTNTAFKQHTHHLGRF